jgi:undecaprenyl phosphate-alpha-L-ara4N flippase subunit ArnE
MEYLLLTISVVLTALSQVWQKLAAHRLDIHYVHDVHRSGAKRFFDHVRQMIVIREAWFALGSLGASMLLWLMVLQHMDISKAFPVVSMSLVLVMLISRFRFGEHIPLRRWLGAAVITLGVCLVASS